MKYRSLNHKVAHLRVGQVIRVLEEDGEIVVSGCDYVAEETVRSALQYVPLVDGSLRLTVRRDSLAGGSGAQFRMAGNA